jgi:hypothetical protein
VQLKVSLGQVPRVCCLGLESPHNEKNNEDYQDYTADAQSSRAECVITTSTSKNYEKYEDNQQWRHTIFLLSQARMTQRSWNERGERRPANYLNGPTLYWSIRWCVNSEILTSDAPPSQIQCQAFNRSFVDLSGVQSGHAKNFQGYLSARRVPKRHFSRAFRTPRSYVGESGSSG